MTTARAAVSAATASIAASSAPSISRDSALKRSPRFIVSVRTPPCVLVNTYGRSPASTSAFIVWIPLLDRVDRSCTLAQQELLDLARRRLRQFAEHDALRHLESREMPAAMLDQLAGLDASARFQFDERARRFAPARIGFRDDRRAEDRRVTVQHVLDFERADVLAARDDDVLRSVADLHVAVGLQHREVAGVEPAAGKRLVGRRRILEVALHRDVAAKHDLAHGFAIRR